MEFPVTIVPNRGNGSEPTFTATIVGHDDLSATADSRDQAILRLREILTAKFEQGELVSITLPEQQGILQMAGIWKDDDDLNEVISETREESHKEISELFDGGR